jgi:hypothetical protein
MRVHLQFLMPAGRIAYNLVILDETAEKLPTPSIFIKFQNHLFGSKK